MIVLLVPVLSAAAVLLLKCSPEANRRISSATETGECW